MTQQMSYNVFDNAMYLADRFQLSKLSATLVGVFVLDNARLSRFH